MLHIIIVLGNPLHDIMEKRLNRSLEEFNIPLYQNYEYEYETFPRKKMILVTGTEKESEFMGDYLLKNGIPSQYILIEKESKNTIDNIKNSYRFIEKNNLFPSRITICTSTFHISRTIVITGLIFGKYMPLVKYIHTNEQVSKEERDKEQSKTMYILDSYVDVGSLF